MLFPENAIAILREARWKPAAKRSFEFMSGGFVWSDERLGDIVQLCTEVDNWAFREIIAYRASLIRNAPRTELRDSWDQLARECPDWPGLRPERSDHSLKTALDSESNESIQQLEHMSEVFERAQRIKAVRNNRTEE